MQSPSLCKLFTFWEDHEPQILANSCWKLDALWMLCGCFGCKRTLKGSPVGILSSSPRFVGSALCWSFGPREKYQPLGLPQWTVKTPVPWQRKEQSGKSVSLRKSQTTRFTLSHSTFTNLATSGQLHFVEDYVLSICLDTLQKSMEPAIEWTQPQVQITIRTGCHHDNQHNSWSMSTSGALFKACGCLW